MTKEFSVVIPSRDRPEDLRRCLASICHADNGCVREIIIVDDGSQTPIRADELTTKVEIRVLRNDTPQGPDRSRNQAAEDAHGELLALFDDDAVVAHDWFEVAMGAVDSGMRVFTGRVLPFDVGLVSRARQWRYDQRYGSVISGGAVNFLAGGNSAIHRDLLLKVGGFPVAAAGADNRIIARLHAIGVSTHFVRELRILHRNGKGVAVAAERAWTSGRVCPPESAATVVRDCAQALGRLHRAPADVAALNGLLELLHSSGRLFTTSCRLHQEQS